jgi:hypothetical protein
VTLKQFGLFPKCCDQSLTTAHAAQSFPSMVAELVQIFRTEIWKIMLFPVTPDIFNRIELRRIRGKKLNLKPPGTCVNKIADQATAVASKSIPDNEKVARDMAQDAREIRPPEDFLRLRETVESKRSTM